MLTYKDTLAQITNDWLQQFNIPDHINHLHIASFYLLESTQGDWVNFLGLAEPEESLYRLIPIGLH